MSEQLTIETLREKFKEAQEKGEQLILLYSGDGYGDVICYNVLFVARTSLLMESLYDGAEEYELDKYLHHYKIKQSKDEYEVLEKGTRFDASKLGRIETFITSDRKLLRNKRTGEIVEYDEELLK